MDTVGALGDVPAVLLIAGGVLAGVIPSQDASSRGWEKRAKSPISAIRASAVSVAIPRNAPLLAIDPRAVLQRPRLLAIAEDRAVTQ